MKRKTFIQKTVGALLLAIPAYALINCSSSDDGYSDGGNNNSDPYNDGNNDGYNNQNSNCLQNGAIASSISSNHGHSLTVSKADVAAGVDKTYSIKGTANHDHEITITAADFNTLKNNMQVGENSTTVASHSHTVTISCA